MRIAVIIFIVIFFSNISKAQIKYLSDIVTKNDNRKLNYVQISFNYWHRGSCLYEPDKICKYNTSTAGDVKVIDTNGKINYIFLRGNNSGYKSKNPYDTLKYFLNFTDMSQSTFIRKVLDEPVFKIDTFNIVIVDTIYFDKKKVIKKVFGKYFPDNVALLKIIVLKSIKPDKKIIIHYWVDRIGVIKMADEECWQYSFEMKDDRTPEIENLYIGLLKAIKEKYTDPYWLGGRCPT